jgi:DNA polymerase (family 10)
MFVETSETLTNRELAATLFNVATLLRDQGENPYRVRAYLRGARALMRRASEPFAPALENSSHPLHHPRYVLGSRLQKRLRELVTTGDLALLDELCAGLPAHIGALMRIPGIGPRLAQRLHDTLGISTPEQFYAAAHAGRLADVWGIGPRRQDQFAQLCLPLFEETEKTSERMAA